MASEKLHQAVPPFPEDIPTAPMHTISLKDLTSGASSAARDILHACQELGFFLLDLHDDPVGEAVIEEVDKLFHASNEILNLPEATKAQYQHDPPRSFLGFKPRGIAKTETKEPDRFEWFNMGQDGLLNNTDLQPLPDQLHTHIPLFTSFLQHGHLIAHAVNTSLATGLGLAPDAFTSLQSPETPSGTVIRLIKAFASPEETDLRTSMIHHTDFGSVTLLANVLGGLQILAPGKAADDESAWLYVRPVPGCLVVNLGDAMVAWSGGLLRSNCHRVNFAPGEQRFVDRYSLAVLFRPGRDASMRRLVGDGDGDGDGEGEDGEEGDLTAWEWEVRKAMALKRGEAVVESKGGRYPAVA